MRSPGFEPPAHWSHEKVLMWPASHEAQQGLMVIR
jgi:hypothetical protein